MLGKLLRESLRPYRGATALAIAFQIVQVTATLYLPNLNADIVDNGVARGDTGHIWRVGAWMTAITCVQILANVVAVYFGARTAMAVGRDLRRRVFRKVESLSARELAVLGAPTLITRTTNDVQQVQVLVLMTFTMVVSAPIMAVGGIAMALRHDVTLSGLMLVVVPVLGGMLAWLIRRMHPLFRAQQRQIDVVTQVVREQIGGVRVVRAFVKDRFEQERFARANDDLYDISLRAGRLMVSMFPLIMLVLNVSTVAVWWFGALRVRDAGLGVGEVIAMMTYLMQILMSVLMASMMFMMMPRAQVAAERITEVLDTESSVQVSATPTPLTTVRGEVELRGACFAYPGAAELVLDDVCLTARPGETVAIIGSTGSGKSTIVNLVPRLMDVTGGAVLVDGVDVRELHPEVLWGAIGLVPQRAYLFSGTVASNLRYGRTDATDEQLWAALEVAQAADFVRALPEGLDAPVTQGGTNLSGGQRQRLAIARAVVRRPAIYLFDDAFSALDYGTDAALRAALRPVTREATQIVVAQRVATIRDADRIVVLHEGRVVGTGRHRELMAGCPTYREIVLSQLTEQEAA